MREGHEIFYALLTVKVSCIQILLAIEGAMISILQKPHFKTAFGRVELCHRAVDFEEHILHYVLSLTSVSDDFERDTEDKTMVPLKQYGKSVVDAVLQLDH